MSEVVSKVELLEQYEAHRVQENVLNMELTALVARTNNHREQLEAQRALVANARERLLGAVESSVSGSVPEVQPTVESVNG